MRKTYLRFAAGLTFAAGVVLRFFYLGKQNLFLDEAWSWAAAELPLGKLLRLPQLDPHPILYYLVLKIGLLFLPHSEAGLRLLSAVFSALSLLILMFLAVRWQGWRAGLYSGLLFAASTFDLYYAQEARMYALLGLMWLISYGLLAEALSGKPRLILLWGAANILLSWTHLYGLLVAMAFTCFAIGLWVWLHWRKQTLPFHSGQLIIAISLTILGSLPVIALALQVRSGQPGGSWIPQVKDLLGLLALTSSGLTAARAYFLDSANLALPFTALIPFWVWAVIGVLLASIAVWACLEDWKQAKDRSRLLLTGLTFLIPAAIFLYTFLFQRAQWAMKPFLGGAYIFYLWVGIGLSRLPARWRIGAAIMVVGIALLSILPYFTTWQKTNPPLDANALTVIDGPSAVILDKSYTAPVALFYLSPKISVWALEAAGEQKMSLLDIHARGILPEDVVRTSCQSPQVEAIQRVYLLMTSQHAREQAELWPPCLSKKALFTFTSGRWQVFTP